MRRGVVHSAARAAMFLGVFFGSFLLLMPGMMAWMSGATLHTLLSDEKGSLEEKMKQLGREARFDPLKTCFVVLSRLPLLLLAVINIHVCLLGLVWVAGNLAGFDTAVLSVQLDDVPGNRAYILSLFLFAWWLLSPYYEASNFLLYLDTRMRQEGLDLLYHVQRLFATERKTAGVAVVLLAVGGLLFAGSGLVAAPPAQQQRLDAVRTVHAEVDRIAGEVKASNPYPGGGRWEKQLERLNGRLQAMWFAEAIEGFGGLSQEQALAVLSDLQNRLSLLDDALSPDPEATENEPPKRSKEDVKNLTRHREDENAPSPAKKQGASKDDLNKRVEIKRDEPEGGGGSGAGGSGGGLIAPGVGGSGLATVGWVILGGLMLAVVVTGLVLLIIHLVRNRSRKPRQATSKPTELAQEAEPPPHEQPVAVLWQQAEKLARDGRHLDALRMLYRAVLSLLHRRQLLHYESTRTNGEYIDEVRLSPQAPAELRLPFERLTNLFEMKWYGDRSCEPAEFADGLALASSIQQMIR
jgi:hypothetical protein